MPKDKGELHCFHADLLVADLFLPTLTEFVSNKYQREILALHFYLDFAFLLWQLNIFVFLSLFLVAAQYICILSKHYLLSIAMSYIV